MSIGLSNIIKAFFGCYVLLFCPFILCAQKLKKREIDRLTGDTMFYTSTEKIAANTGMLNSSAETIEAYATKSKDIIILTFKVALTSFDHDPFQVSEGKRITIKLTTSSFLDFYSIGFAQAEYESLGSEILPALNRGFWSASVAFALTKDDIYRITGATIVRLSIQADEKNLNFEVKRKYSEVIKNILLLIANAK